ncbi:unnamed protein product [Tilletia controversa]|uniref:Senescence domain-containing protein n=2 Tax=Tilletia TaxID=13289 RepID=A0A8X7MMZ8_9BASI|nr:hypothetical protein CF328_g7795 [Tilletia controversa]KAE8185767.1 hypothetical protein CF335_g7633 [Tilletia laevis]KAE8252572.1 hypothetical protein A4X03_0g6127 [Tilletia caries]KAE8242098.1 hypothetical protein A4X06_0g7242 [Tilletia controversa]CAD6884057.1 unnamed protein product [Tilletia caries]
MTTTSGPRGVELISIEGGVELWEASPAAAHQEASQPNLTKKLASGNLSALLVTIDVDNPSHTSEGNPDIWLVLNIRNTATATDRPFPLTASQRVVAHRPTHSYRFIEPPEHTNDIILKLPGTAPGTDEKTPFEIDPAAEAYFEDILAQYCAFEEPSAEAPPPSWSAATATRSTAASDSASLPGLPPRGGQGEIELFDEHGKLIGHLEGKLEEHPSLHRDALSSSRNNLDAKNPVLIDLSGSQGPRISPLANGDEVALAQTAHYRDGPGGQGDVKTDWLIHSAQFLGRGLVKGSMFLGSKLNSAADSYIERSPGKRSGTSSPSNGPVYGNEKGSGLVSSPVESHFPRNPVSSSSGNASSRYERTTTGDVSRSHYINKYSAQAVSISQSTTSAILGVASNVGDRVGRATGIQRKPQADGTPGPPPKGVRGVINRGIIAASTLLDSIEQAGETLVADSGSAASRVIGHKYGADAERRAGNVALAGRNVYCVYKDIMGVRRRCLVRVAVGSSLKARTPEGELVEVRMGGGEQGGTIVEKAPIAPEAQPISKR